MWFVVRRDILYISTDSPLYMWLTVISYHVIAKDLTMNAGLAHTIDSLFGPASEKVDVNAFIESEKVLYQDTLSNQTSPTIADECRFYNFLFARFIP